MGTIGSLFSGIGGLERGLEQASGAHTVWNCETEPFCRKVLAKHWPEAVQYTDVHDIDDTVERVDIIAGGFPCQDLSVAGSRKGLGGERSGLWHEYARIIRLLQPRFVFVENVPALRTLVSDDGLGRVLGDLAERGYDTEWDCVPAASVGAPHVRDRIFLLAWRRELTPSEAQRPAQRERDDEVRGLEHDFPPRPGADDWIEWLKAHPTAHPGVRRDPEGARGRGDQIRRQRLKALGNAVVPQAAAYAWHLLTERAGVSL